RIILSNPLIHVSEPLEEDSHNVSTRYYFSQENRGKMSIFNYHKNEQKDLRRGTIFFHKAQCTWWIVGLNSGRVLHTRMTASQIVSTLMYGTDRDDHQPKRSTCEMPNINRDR